jgi:hypothetical protein
LNTQTKKWISALLLLALAGCYRSVIKGKVVDLDGKALPGVAVSTEGTKFQDLSNALGEYGVRYRPGPVRLHFDKTGYTPAVVNVDAGAVWGVKSPDVTLWCLPENRGVFFFENGRYSPTDPVEPTSFVGGIYGTEKWPSALSTNPRPRLIAHRLPLEGVSLVQLKYIEAVPDKTVTQEAVDAWVAGPPVPIQAVPIDTPQHLLVELRYQGNLAPGTYAVQWGALEGKRDPVPSIYIFSIESEPGAAKETAQEEPPKEAKPAKPEKAKKAKEQTPTSPPTKAKPATKPT